MPSVFIKTYGCQMNERDSEAVAAQLVAKGYTLAESEAVADVILLNTCSVRELAEQKALGKMASLAAEVRAHRPGVILGFMGCMAQRQGRRLLERFPEVALVTGTQKVHRVADYVEELLAGRRDRIVDVGSEPDGSVHPHLHLQQNRGLRPVTAFVSIMQGCNHRCAFCVVPTTRGPERSRPIADIVAECRQLAAAGVKEVTLLGQVVTSYGRREIPVRDGKSPFVQLLEAVHEVEGLERIRFTASHPIGYGEDLIEAYGRLPKLVESAHLPVQSGSNRILRLMRRGYTRERYLELVAKLRRVQPRLGLCTDIIVGFPGETEEDFQQTLSLMEEAQFDQAFLFKYSPREGTAAVDLPDPVPQQVREERHQRALALMNQLGRRKYEACVGQIMQILVEGPSKNNPARLMGRTRCNKIVVFEGSPRHYGQLLDVRIVRAGSFTLYGDPAIKNLD